VHGKGRRKKGEKGILLITTRPEFHRVGKRKKGVRYQKEGKEGSFFSTSGVPSIRPCVKRKKKRGEGPGKQDESNGPKEKGWGGGVIF